MPQAIDAAPRGWGWTLIVTILGTLACTALVAWFNGLAGKVGNLAIAAGLAAPLFFYFANGLRCITVARRRRIVTASTDALTGVFNRRAFVAAANAYFAAVHEYDRPARGALLAIDIDNLKAINDAFGHETGDRAIAEVAHALRAVVRSTDLVGRLGGDEFGILLIGTDQIQSQAVADRVSHAIETIRFTVDDGAQPLAVSTGIALFGETTTLPDLIDAADRALYAAKQNGGNRNAISPVEPRNLQVAA